MTEVLEAYEILGDEDERKLYDVKDDIQALLENVSGDNIQETKAADAIENKSSLDMTYWIVVALCSAFFIITIPKLCYLLYWMVTKWNFPYIMWIQIF